MMDGKSKAQLLLSLLGPEGRGVLEKLSKSSAQLLTTGIDNLPTVSVEDKLALIREIQSSSDGFEPESLSNPFDQPVSLDEGFSFDEHNDSIPDTIDTPSIGFDPAVESNDTQMAPEPIVNSAPTPVANANYADIGAALAKQRPQVIAFILSRLDETMKASVQRHIPADVLAEAQSKSLEMVPMSEKVYQKIYDSVFKNLN